MFLKLTPWIKLLYQRPKVVASCQGEVRVGGLNPARVNLYGWHVWEENCGAELNPVCVK